MPRLAARTSNVAAFRVMEMADRAWRLMADGRDVIFLLAGEPDFGTPPQDVEAAAHAAASGRVQHTGSLGVPALREAIAAMYGERFGVAVPVERVVVTTGASAALVPVVPEVAFYVYADSTRFGADSTDVALRLLERASVACTPGADCGGAEGHRHLRFSYTAPATTIADALDRIEAELR